MKFRFFSLIACIIGVAAPAASASAATDWSEYIADLGSVGLDTISMLRDAQSEVLAARTGIAVPDALNTGIKRFSVAVTVTEFIPNAVLRSREFSENPSQAILEQAGIEGTKLLLSREASVALSACFASGVCALSGAGFFLASGTVLAAAGLAIDADLIAHIVEGRIDKSHEDQQLAASQQRTAELQQRVDELRELRQQLQLLKNTNEWQVRKNDQLAAQKAGSQPGAVTPEKLSVPNAAQPSIAALKPVQSISQSSKTPAPAPSIYVTTPRGTPRAQQTSSTPALSSAALQQLKARAVSLQPGPSPSPPPPKPAYVAPPVATSTFKPGGISLSIAAAMRMRLPTSLRSLSYSNGSIVLSGEARQDEGVDAALFLTAMRAACEPGDPYFSLDPDDGRAWTEETSRVFDEFWASIRKDLDVDGAPGWDKRLPNGFNIRTISARRDYPARWNDILPRYPNLKSRLVFRQEWLRGTRFGEVLYRADVLLKELSTGAPLLATGTDVRAKQVSGFIPSDARRAAKALLAGYENATQDSSQMQYRLWFDLFPQRDEIRMVMVSPSEVRQHSSDPGTAALRTILQSRGYLSAQTYTSQPRILSKDGDIVDVSSVYPAMFVRRHNLSTGMDLIGGDPNLDDLADDVNQRTQAYVNAYDELRALMNVFRAYVAAVSIVQRDQATCSRIRSIPMLATEKVERSLPSHHASELVITVATYLYRGPRGSKFASGSARTMNGGISLRGKSFFAERMHLNEQTPMTLDLRRALAQSTDSIFRPYGDNQQLITLIVDSGALLHALGEPQTSVSAAPEQVLRREQELRRSEIERAAVRSYEESLRSWEKSVDEWHEVRRRWEEADKQWREANETWQREERNAAAASRHTVETPIDPKLAARILPYALILDGLPGGSVAGDTREGYRFDWETIFLNAHYTRDQIEFLKKSGFKATVHQNRWTEEVTVYYQGGFGPLEDHSNKLLLLADWNAQYKAAADLAWITKHAVPPGTTVSLFGIGVSAALAAYAGEQTDLPRVVTFGANESHTLIRRASPVSLNVGWRFK
jgi:hypothetical protein